MKSLREFVTTLSCENLLECVFGLNSLDIHVYEILCGGAERIEEISRAVGRGESAVYKSLQKLVVAGLVYRVKVPLNGGGYYFLYKPAPKHKVAEEIEKVVGELCTKIKRTLEEFLNDSRTGLPRLRNLQ